MSRERDARLQRAASRYGATVRRLNATDQERDEAKRDLCAVQIEVAAERGVADSPLPFTEDQLAAVWKAMGGE